MKEKTLEERVYGSVCEGLASAISERINRGYQDNPLNKMVDEVVLSRAHKLKPMIESAIDEAFTADFQKALQEAVVHKLSRILISKLEGEVEKRANELRSSVEFRAKLTLAIEKAVREAGQ